MEESEKTSTVVSTVDKSPEETFITIETNQEESKHPKFSDIPVEGDNWKEICDLTNSTTTYPVVDSCEQHQQQLNVSNSATTEFNNAEIYNISNVNAYTSVDDSSITPFHYGDDFYNSYSQNVSTGTSFIDDVSSYEYNNIHASTNYQNNYNYDTTTAYYTSNTQSDTIPYIQDNVCSQSYNSNENPGMYSQEYGNSFDQDLIEWSHSIENQNSGDVSLVDEQQYSRNVQPANANSVEDTNDSWTAEKLFDYSDNSEQCNAENSAWLQSTVNELFAESRDSSQVQIPSESPSETINLQQASHLDQNYPQNNHVNMTCELLSPPITPTSNISKPPSVDSVDSENITDQPSAGSYLFYVPMRVSRNPDTGNIHMQYECLPSDSSYQPQPYSTTNKVNYSSNEVNQGKKNPPKTVRELLEEYRQKLYYPETTYRYCPEDSDKSSYHYVQQYNSSVVQNPEYRTEPTDSSNEMYSTNYTVDSKVQSPVPSSNVSNNDPIYSNYADQPYTSYQQFSNEGTDPENSNCNVFFDADNDSNSLHNFKKEDHCDMNSTKSVQISSLESGSPFINTPLTPDNTDTSIVSPAQSEEMTTSTRTSLPGIQYIKGISFEHYFTKSIEQDKNTGDLNTIPEFIEGPVDVKEHRPRHFEMLSLQIGVFNAVEISHNCESRKMTNKFKVLFSKRRLVYEFIWPNRQFDSVKTDVIELACIYVPFKSIEALNITENEVIVHVNCKPHIYGGSKQSSNGIVSSANIFNTKKELDITDGQLSLAPVHKVTLKSNQCSKLKNFLTAFDRRFWYLLHREIPQAAYNETVLPEYTESIQKNSVQTPCKRMLDKKGPTNDKKKICKTSNSCSCKISCRSMRCSCSKFQLKCGSLCQCENCENPLNVLCDLGKKMVDILSDTCLMHNVFKLICLESSLKAVVQLDCCEKLVKVSDLIPGQVSCPYGCEVFYHYSWCSFQVHNENNPRDHCLTCMKCIACEEDHSEICRKNRLLSGTAEGMLTRGRSQAISKNDN